jgi:hypothetical protein
MAIRFDRHDASDSRAVGSCGFGWNGQIPFKELAQVTASTQAMIFILAADPPDDIDAMWELPQDSWVDPFAFFEVVNPFSAADGLAGLHRWRDWGRSKPRWNLQTARRFFIGLAGTRAPRIMSGRGKTSLSTDGNLCREFTKPFRARRCRNQSLHRLKT